MRRIALVAMLSALLSGCFSSEKPMFSAATAVLALGDGGKYATFEQLADGKEEPSDTIEVRLKANNVYDFIDEKGVATPVTIHPLSGDEHVVQAKLKDGYGYLVIRTSNPKEAIVTPVECNKQDEAKMAQFGVVRLDRFECRIDKVADPIAFFTAVTRSKPVSRMVLKEP
jgi:hypothetical protein